MNIRKIVIYTLIPFSLLFILSISYVISAAINISKYPGIYDGFYDLMVLANSPIVSDRSFNEAMMAGANSYKLEADEEYGKDVVEIGEANPQEIDNFEQYQNLISLIYDSGGDVITTAGYNLLDAVLGKSIPNGRDSNGSLFIPDYNDKKFVLIDDSFHSSSINRNVISFRFESEYGGFLAGVSAAIYATCDGSYTVSTFGGKQFVTVYDWMSGYEQGINWYNYQVLGYQIDGGTNNQAYLYGTEYDNNGPVQITNGDYSPDYSKPTSQTLADSWYTGNFDIGEATPIAAKQIDYGSTVIFPVAGGQTVDALNQAKLNNNTKDENVRVIGVDSDAALAYPDYQEEILGSSIKDVAKATEIGFWYADRFIDEYQQDEEQMLDSSLDQELFDKVSKTPDEGGWKEDNPAFTSRDFAQMDDNQIDDYLNSSASASDGATYVDNVDNSYYYVGEELDYGSEFVGNYKNGGIYFIASEELQKCYHTLWLAASDNSRNENIPLENYEDINDFYAYGIEENEVIETMSNTFSASNSTPKTLGTDFYDNAKGLWIPDWGVYKKI